MTRTRNLTSLIVIVIALALSIPSMLAFRDAVGVPGGEHSLDDSVREALTDVFPDAARFDAWEALEGGFVAVDQDDEPTGYAVVSEGKGYGGPMRLLVGVGSRGAVMGARLLEHQETDGFIDDILAPEYREQFTGKRADDPIELERDIDGVSGATGSARGFAEAVRAGVTAIEEAR